MTCTRFKRGPERRTPSGAGKDERRHDERRSRGLRWIPLFRNADEDAVNEALGGLEVVSLPAGTPLLRPGETNQNVYIVLSGQMAAFLDVEASPEAAIAIAPGQCVGELSAIDGKPVSALVRAVTDARVLRVSREVFWGRLLGLPGVAGNLMVSLTERMRRTNELALHVQREHLELAHLRKELDMARQLQAGMLPLHRPLFPERREIEVCALMHPASIVGGDLFDVFFVDDRHLFFCVGDVSGHGIGAALFMARTIGLLRVLAMGATTPEDLLTKVNDQLCEGNESSVFVTLFCGFLDVESGRITYSNGGHCAPIIAAGGRTGLLPLPAGALVGAFPGMAYSAMEHVLEPGDTLLVYTDGITEAQAGTGEEFSEQRCLDVVGRSQAMPLPELLDLLRLQVAHFTGSDTLEDDCTMLVLRRRFPDQGVAAA